MHSLTFTLVPKTAEIRLTIGHPKTHSHLKCGVLGLGKQSAIGISVQDTWIHAEPTNFCAGFHFS